MVCREKSYVVLILVFSIDHVLDFVWLPSFKMVLFSKCFAVWIYYVWGFPGDSDGKESASSAGDLGLIPGSDDLLEKEVATLSSILAWKIPWTEEPGELQSMGWQRVRHDWETEHSKPGNTMITFYHSYEYEKRAFFLLLAQMYSNTIGMFRVKGGKNCMV